MIVKDSFPENAFRGKVVFITGGIRGDKDWVAVCNSIGRNDLIEDERFTSLEGRVRHSRELIGILDAPFAQKDLAEWRAIFKEHDLTCSPVWELRDVADDPAMAANDIIVEMNHPEYGPMKTVNSPTTVQGSKKVPPRPAPELGQHTKEILM